jgi:hypothetical protein
MFGLVFSEKLTGKSIEVQSMPQPGTFDLLAFASASPLILFVSNLKTSGLQRTW